jgi:hypothetical protein
LPEAHEPPARRRVPDPARPLRPGENNHLGADVRSGVEKSGGEGGGERLPEEGKGAGAQAELQIRPEMEETAARCQRRHCLAAGALTKPHCGSYSSLRESFASCNLLLEVPAFLPKLDRLRFSDSLHVGIEKTKD